MIYANKESRTDIDVEKISIKNCMDVDEDMTEVLSPMTGKRDEHQTPEQDGMRISEAMFRLRTRDKFKVVSQAPWRVFDQYEIFICP